MSRILRPLLLACAVTALVAPATASAQRITNDFFGGWAESLALRSDNFIWQSSFINGQVDENGTPLPGTPFGDFTNADMVFQTRDGVDYAFQTDYASTRILDVSDPANPVEVGRMLCGGAQGDISIHGNLLFRSQDGSHSVPYGDLSRGCERAGNEVQRVALAGFDTDGDSFRLRFGGNDTEPIVRGTSYSTVGIQRSLQGVNEQQQVVLTGFDAATDSFRVVIGGEQSSLLGTGGATVTNANVAAAVNGITGFAGTVTASGSGNSGFTLTFAGASATTDVPDVAILFVDCPAATCAAAVNETLKGQAPVAGWPDGATVTVSGLTDGGFSVTFAGTLAASDVAMLSVTDEVGTTATSVKENLKGAPGQNFQGLHVIDITDLENPKHVKSVPVCGGGHTNTSYFDEARNRVVVYMTRSATTGSNAAFGVNCAGLPSGRLTAVTVPLGNPKAARIASENIVYGSGGCHDVNIHEERKLLGAACLGSGIWMLDISDPLNASLKWGPFTWPNHGTWHSALWSWDGKYVYANGEPGGGGGAECAFNDHPAKPTIFILSAETGQLEGTWTLPRPQTDIGGENCTIHTLNMVPVVDRHLIAASCYVCGMMLVDVTNPKAPAELGFVDPHLPAPTQGESGRGCWTGYWYNGSLFCSELNWGLHIFTVDEPWWGKALAFTELNPQVNDSSLKCEVSYAGGPARAGVNGSVTATVRAYGPAPLQPVWGAKVRVSGPGFSKVAETGQDGKATIAVRATKAGRLNVAVPPHVNLVDGCSAPSKAIARKAVK